MVSKFEHAVREAVYRGMRRDGPSHEFQLPQEVIVDRIVREVVQVLEDALLARDSTKDDPEWEEGVKRVWEGAMGPRSSDKIAHVVPPPDKRVTNLNPGYSKFPINLRLGGIVTVLMEDQSLRRLKVYNMRTSSETAIRSHASVEVTFEDLGVVLMCQTCGKPGSGHGTNEVVCDDCWTKRQSHQAKPAFGLVWAAKADGGHFLRSDKGDLLVRDTKDEMLRYLQSAGLDKFFPVQVQRGYKPPMGDVLGKKLALSDFLKIEHANGGVDYVQVRGIRAITVPRPGTDPRYTGICLWSGQNTYTLTKTQAEQLLARIPFVDIGK